MCSRSNPEAAFKYFGEAGSDSVRELQATLLYSHTGENGGQPDCPRYIAKDGCLRNELLASNPEVFPQSRIDRKRSKKPGDRH